MKRFSFFLPVCLLLIFSLSQISEATSTKLVGARFPSISPNGKLIAFSYIGDLWNVSKKGGKATRLTDHIAYDSHPVWSPNGKWIAFTSNRTGNDNIFLIKAEGGTAQQITFHTGNDVVTDFTPDGKWIIFESSRSSMSSIYKINIDGGNAVPLLDTYWSWPYQAKIDQAKTTMLFSLGMENRSTWRKGYKGSNSSKIWTKNLMTNQAKLIISEETNCFWPNWSVDGKKIYFVTDKNVGKKNIWSANKDGSGIKSITKFKKNDISNMSVAKNAEIAVYEKEFDIWYTDLITGKSEKISIEAPTETKDNQFFYEKNKSVSEFRVSPDGNKIAAVVRGEIFVLSTDGGYARNITKSTWRERDIWWDKDSKNIIYISDINANPDLFIISALGNEKPKRLTNTDEDESSPKVSPDGKWIAYYCGKDQIRLVQPDGKKDKLLIEDEFGGRFSDDFSWSPDSRFLAIVPQRNANRDIFAINIESKQKTLLTNTAYDENSPLWSPNGKFMLFSSNRYGHSFPEFTGKWDLYQVQFEQEKPKFKEDDFEKLFKSKNEEEEEKDKKGKKDKSDKKKKDIEVKFKLDNIDKLTKTVTNTLGNDGSFFLSPLDTTTVYFVSNIDGKRHLWETSLKEKERGKYKPFLPQIKNPGSLQCANKGRKLYYLSNGKIGYINLKSKKSKSISFDTKIKVDKTADYEQTLGELYYTLEHYYYDKNHHNINWKKMCEKYKPVLQQVREDRDFYDYANELIGHLNSSHTGMRWPRGRRTENPSAHTGAIWDFTNNKISVKQILKDGPAYAHRDSISVGDLLTAINGKKVTATENIWKHLNGKQDKKLTLTFKSQKLNKEIDISLKAISARAETNLVFEEWVKERQKIVRQKTDDQVAYIYMKAMGYGNLVRFLKELERDAVPRKGLILDLRNNFGGNVHDRVLQALMKPVYGNWQIRGFSKTNQSTFGFAHKPVVLLINEVTLSDGEMTANGFKELKRGPVVGNTTYDWLIFTTSARLMNGASFRLPFWGCYTLDGKDLETHGGVTPDILIINDLNHDLANQDPQLDKAIEKALELIKE